MLWGTLLREIFSKIATQLLADSLKDAIKGLPPKVINWWNGRKIAVIGPTAAGKNSFYHRLRGEPLSDEHVQTRGPEKVETFTFKRALPNNKVFKIRCRGSINVGGEADERDRFWLHACNGADVIFYMLTLDDLREKRFHEGSRVYGDLRWLGAHMGQMKPNTLVHLLVNKIDGELKDGARYAEFQRQHEPALDELEKTTKALLGPYNVRLSGISPTSMTDPHLFGISFASALESVYDAVHP